MSKLEKLPIFFITVETLVTQYTNNENMYLNNLGIILDYKKILSQVLYTKYEIKSCPYGIMVDKNSFDSKRKIILTYIIEDIIIKRVQKGSGKSNSTINQCLIKIINFLNWANENNLCFLKNIEDATSVFWQYTYYLKDRIRLGTYSQGDAHRNHQEAYTMLHAIFNDTENKLLVGNKIITNKRSGTLSKSSKADQKYHAKFCYNLFHQLTDFLLEKKDYPFKLEMPSGDIWCMPSQRNFVNNNENCPDWFDYDTGKILSIEEMLNLKKLKYPNDAKKNKERFLKNIDKHNLNTRSHKRLYLGHRALMAYYLYFLTATQMNDSVAATLLWNNDYKIEKDKQKFKNIKYRARNKPVEFQLQSRMIKDFQKFLTLRDYLLDGNDFEYLFFVRDGVKPKLSTDQKTGHFSSRINRIFIDTIDPKLPRLNSKQLRVNKTNQVIKQDGIIAASQLAQSSINTMINSYQGESQESTDEQFGEYFNLLNQDIFREDENEINTAVGRCKKPDQAESDIALKGISIDCSKSEGCLFCKHYGLHADDEDIKKIYSLKYVINESRYIAKNEDHFIEVYGIILNRIDNIISQIIKEGRQSKENIDLFQKDVFENENLHPYWEYKLNTLIKMGVLA